MNKLLIITAISSVMSVAIAADISGGSSTDGITVGKSSFLPFGAGDPGIKIGDNGFTINLENGPIKHINKKYGGTYNFWNGNQTSEADAINSSIYADLTKAEAELNPKFLTTSDVNPVVGFFNKQTLAQVWHEKRKNNTHVYSVRQIANPTIAAAPKFGGVVISKLSGLDDSQVYFGEWAPRLGTPNQTSTAELYMDQEQHTVWFVGENPTKNIHNLATAEYSVLGVNKHRPGRNDFYNGTLTATFGTTAPKLTGSLSRGVESVNFTNNNVAINMNDGSFQSNDAIGNVKGQFYGNNAAALAGYHKNGTANQVDDVAFGGKKK